MHSSERLLTWRWSGHVHGWSADGSLPRGEQWCGGAHLTGGGFVPPGLPLAGPWGGSLAHGLVSSVCAGRLGPAAPVSRGLPLRLGGLVPAVLAHAARGPSVAGRGVAGGVPAGGGGACRGVARCGVPHAGAGGGPWGLAAFGAAGGFIPSAV